MNASFSWNFDARAVQPSQGGGKHPVGNKFPFRITDVSVEKVKDKDAGRLAVELTSDLGTITKNYNMWNESAAAREIAGKELSALCHAVGIFQIGANQGKELIGGRGLMDVGFQRGQEPSAEKPEGGYVEVKKIYDLAGNEPGKAPMAQGQPNSGFQQPQQQPNPGAATGAPQPQSGGQWSQPNNQQPQQPQQQPANQQPPNGQGGWQQPQQQPNQPQQPNQSGGWQQNNGGAPQSAPWANR